MRPQSARLALPDGLILPFAGGNYEFEAFVADMGCEGITGRTLRIVDVDGGESASYDVFDRGSSAA